MPEPEYQHAISGLIKKRGEMMAELSDLRERIAVITHDVESLDRVLERLGYEGEIKLTPRAARIILFYRNELRVFLLGELRKASKPLTSRDLASALMMAENKDVRDRRMMNDIVKRMGKALRQMRSHGTVCGTKIGNEYLWAATTA